MAKNFFKVDVEDIIVLVDDMDTEPGHIRLRLKGEAGGHNGLKSIISLLGTNEFKRIRIGIGKPKVGSTPDYVLSAPRDSLEYQAWKDSVKHSINGWGISKACEALEYSLKFNFEKAMSIYNR